jgi:short-subunit dehydrogenase
MQHIVITGASSGIGEALAFYYARQGARLSLCGRDPGRLENVATGCRAYGVPVETRVLDVTDGPAVQAWLLACDDAHPVSLVIANAGISGGTGGMFDGETQAQAQQIFRVNVEGVLNTAYPLIPRMCARGRGQIALMSSLAGAFGWPGAPAYCGSKAAVRVLGQSLRLTLAPAGVKVNVICPGFVRSRMTEANPFPMPFLMEVFPAAAKIARGLERNRGRISFPLVVVFFVWLFSCLPDIVVLRILSAFPAKNRV